MLAVPSDFLSSVCLPVRCPRVKPSEGPRSLLLIYIDRDDVSGRDYTWKIFGVGIHVIL